MYLVANPNGYCNHRVRLDWAEATKPLKVEEIVLDDNESNEFIKGDLF